MTITPLDIAAVVLFVIAFVLAFFLWCGMFAEMQAEADEQAAWRDAQHAALLSLHIMRTVRRP